MFYAKTNDIKDFPFQEAAYLAPPELEEWASKHNLTIFSAWMLPQILAYFGSFKVAKVEGKYSPMDLLTSNIKGNDWAIGLWRVTTKLRRGLLVKSQNTMPEYSALVPLILAGLKKYQGIRYEDWDIDGLEHLVETSLFEAMQATPPDISLDRLMEIRKQGLTIKTGTNAGTMKKATSVWKLTGIQDTELGSLPYLATTMITQIWVAHPSLRNNYMVLDPVNWDNMPRPLIEVDVLDSKPKEAKIIEDPKKLPWE